MYIDLCEQFSCQMCGTCCRNHWQVTMDEASYRRNEALFTASGRKNEFAQAFIALDGQGGYGEYAYIAKQAGGGCWFLDNSNMCLLHKEAGHSHLDAVCRTFPRYPMNTARGIEITLSFSCPAVLKLADRDEPLRIVRSETQPIDLVDNNYAAEIYPQQQPDMQPLRYYFELETHFIDLLQCRTMPLSERLAFLADTAKAVNGLSQDRTIARKLTALFNRNYDWLDALAVTRTPAEPEAGIGLLENFFVSLLFKKPFYIYGFEKTLRLFDHMWQHIMNADDIAKTIMKLEFQYGHDRQALLR
ncbi:flagellin lysine-N-methylase [Sporomusa sp.]|uniref:flagellin lysine-N-methylase n=1 Tax=Sporomusa sp. TaxID=2078658 RepID=UPI002CC062F7|nr:flagellin lysine-N-methylase [Sporomusa sp.]HWR41770.1 flagellin lysine-N-methylase [Sporomusa sp.]